MRWDDLKEGIKALQLESDQSPTPWPDGLDPNVKAAWQKHEAFVFDYLIGALDESSIDDQEKAIQLYNFLFVRDTLIKQQSANYTFRNSPANSACLLVAMMIADPDDNLCGVLMPGIDTVLDPTEADFKSATENVEGKFLPMDFLAATDGARLIPLRVIFEVIKSEPARLFSEEGFFQLSVDDHYNLRRTVSDNKAAEYLDLLEKVVRIREHKKPSVGLALSILQRALEISSKAMSGTETEAVLAQCEAQIITFYALWKKIPADTKNKIKEYTVTSDAPSLDAEDNPLPKPTLERFLVQLFGINPEKMPLSDSEYQCMTALYLLHCGELMSVELAKILSDHPDLYSIPQPGFEADFDDEKAPEAAEIQAAYEAVMCRLDNRPSIIGRDDYCIQRIAYFEIIVRAFCHSSADPEHTFESEVSLKPAVLQDVADMLSLLPTCYWSHYFKHYHSVVTTLFFQQRNKAFHEFQEHYYTVLLRQLPTKQWGALFSAVMVATEWADILRAWDIAKLLADFPKLQWQDLYEALGEASRVCVFEDDSALPVFFSMLWEREWHARTLLFQKEIKIALGDDPSVRVVLLLDQYETDAWPEILSVLQPFLEECLKDFKVALAMISRFVPNEKIALLAALLSIMKDFKLDVLVLAALFKGLPKEDWAKAFKLLEPYLLKAIPNDTAFSTFLNQASTIDTVSELLHAMQPFFQPSRIGNRHTFLTVLEQYPDCEQMIVAIYQNALPGIFSKLLTVFRELSIDLSPVPLDLKKDCYELMQKTLPIVLDRKYLLLIHADADFSKLPEDLEVLLSSFEAIENELLRSDIVVQKACDKKFAQDPWRTALESFGLDFFETVYHYRVIFKSQLSMENGTSSRSRFAALRLMPPPAPVVAQAENASADFPAAENRM